MSLAFLFNVPIKVQFRVAGAIVTTNALEALLGEFLPADTSSILLELDASIREDHTLTAESTDLPIETGSVISDHIILRPRTLTIESTVSDSPVQYLSALSTGSVGNWGGQKLSSSLEAWRTLTTIWFDRVPFDVVTGRDYYKNMIITSLTSPASAKIGRQTRFTANLKQLQIVTKEFEFNQNSVLATDAELGYLSNQIPSAVTIAQATAFAALIGLQLTGVI